MVAEKLARPREEKGILEYEGMRWHDIFRY